LATLPTPNAELLAALAVLALPTAVLLAPLAVACVPNAAALAPAAVAPNPPARASVPVAVGKAKPLVLLPTIGKFLPNPVNWETLTASLGAIPAATLTMRRSVPAPPTETTLASPPSVEPAPSATELFPVEMALLPTAVALT